MWGRSIFSNIRKFLQFQVTVNISCLFIVFITCLIWGESPFSIIQLLWINLIMDMLAALALTTEPPSQSTMKGHPLKITDSMFSPVIWRGILGQSAYCSLVMLVLLFFGPLFFNLSYDFIGSENFDANGDPTDKTKIFTIMFHAFVCM